jgi:hypothetical protein
MAFELSSTNHNEGRACLVTPREDISDSWVGLCFSGLNAIFDNNTQFQHFFEYIDVQTRKKYISIQITVKVLKTLLVSTKLQV